MPHKQKGGRAAGNETVSVPIDAELKRAMEAAMEAYHALRRWEEAIDGTATYELRYPEIDECADKIFNAVHDMFAIWAVQYTMET